MGTCAKCGEIYDTDFQLESDNKGDCICDNCFKDISCQDCGEKLLDHRIEDGICVLCEASRDDMQGGFN